MLPEDMKGYFPPPIITLNINDIIHHNMIRNSLIPLNTKSAWYNVHSFPGKPKTFCIYCSGGASRVIKFYSFNENIKKYNPKKVIYDGDNPDVIERLSKLFDKKFIHFNESIKQYDKKKIHSSTSKFIHYILNKESIDYLLCFGNKILKKELIYSYPDKLINFHPSILPSFKGIKAIDQALDFGAVFLGNTAHFIDEGIDTGRIIIQSAMLTEDYEDYEDVLEMQLPMIKMVLRDILNYNISQNDLKKELINRKKSLFIPDKCVKRSYK